MYVTKFTSFWQVWKETHTKDSKLFLRHGVCRARVTLLCWWVGGQTFVGRGLCEWCTKVFSLLPVGAVSTVGRRVRQFRNTTSQLHLTNHTSTQSIRLALDLTTDFIRNDTHPFNGPLSGTTEVSRYQKGKTTLDFTEVCLGVRAVWPSTRTTAARTDLRLLQTIAEISYIWRPKRFSDSVEFIGAIQINLSVCMFVWEYQHDLWYQTARIRVAGYQ